MGDIVRARPSRRTFLKSSAALGAALAAGPVFAPAVHAASKKFKVGYVTPKTGPLAGFAASDDFNLKLFAEAAKGGVKGPAGTYEAPTREYEGGVERATTGGFRRYARLPEFYADYVALVCEGDRYQQARGKRGRDYYQALREAGYSTNPRYEEELMVFYRQIGCEQR